MNDSDTSAFIASKSHENSKIIFVELSF